MTVIINNKADWLFARDFVMGQLSKDPVLERYFNAGTHIDSKEIKTSELCLNFAESYHAERMKDYENITIHDLFEFYKDSDKSNHTFNSSVLSVLESLKGEKG